MKVALKKNVIETPDLINSDPASPLNTNDPSVRPAFRSLKNIPSEHFNEKSPRSGDNLTPKSRPLRASERLVRKITLTEDDKAIPENFSSIPTEGKEVIPTQHEKHKPKPPQTDSTRLSLNMPKQEHDFLTPKHSSSRSEIIKIKNRSHANLFINADHSDQGMFPKIGEQSKKEKEVVSPISLTNLPEIKMKVEVLAEMKPATKKRTLMRSQTNMIVESTLDDTQPLKSVYVSSPRTKLGKNTQLQPIKEAKQDTEKYLGDDGEEKISKAVKKNVKKTSSFRQLIFSPQVDKAVFKKHLLMVHSGLIYSTQFLKGPSSKFLELKQISLGDPSQTKLDKKTLLLDLDETLIKCCVGASDPDKIVYAKKDDQTLEIPFKIRPYTSQFLKKLKNYYEIVVFTASANHYAKAIIESIDSEGIISFILDRTYCLETKNGYAIKDLRIIKNRELKNMIIVDNLVQSFGLQIENGVPILEWNGNKEDKELNYLMDYLVEASYAEDIREFNAEHLKLKELVNTSLPHVLLQNWQ